MTAETLIAPGCPDVVRGLDLGVPALLEASAGTGKTYAIEHLVLRILTELEDVELAQVLVLTYTEKATGELKEKIRARLGGRLAGEALHPRIRARLNEAYLNFDRASIHTIHGFCQRMLRNYAFENRAPFDSELADDKEVYARALAEEMRSSWLAGAGGPEFQALLSELNLGAQYWDKNLTDLARKFNPFRHDLLLPEDKPEFALQRRAIASLRRRADEDKRLGGLLSYDDMVQHLCAAVRTRPDLVASLRRQFRFCLVDEFQDTDPLQWEIFRTVFLESPGRNPLFLIGDPKQAIYRFRGGDVYTYLAARNLYQDLSREGKARGLGLDMNFRSRAALVEAGNAIFGHPKWFEPGMVDAGDEWWRLPRGAERIAYAPVGCGGRPEQECRESGLPHAGHPVVVRDFGGPDKKDRAHRAANRWIAECILELMARPESLSVPDKGGFRPLEWADLCVLVRNRKEKKLIEQEFQRKGIPFQTVRREGLYQSEAADHFLALFESMEDPHDKGKHARALLTRFLRAPGDPPPDGVPADVHPRFEGWASLARAGEWQRLVQALLYDSGLLYREAIEPDGERRVMDFIHLGQNIVREALRESFPLEGLVAWLRELRAEKPDPEEEKHLHREDSERGKVVIMTLHVSKGLEFPVVFLAALSGSRGDAYSHYHDGGRNVFQLDRRDKAASERAKEEAADEEKRLLYVGFTRARYKLFLPLPRSRYGGHYPPLGGFAATAVKEAARKRPELFHWDERDPATIGPSLVDLLRAAVAAAESARPGAEPAEEPPTASPASLPSLTDYTEDRSLEGADFLRRRRRLSSYSHLVRREAMVATEELLGRHDREDAPEAPSSPAPGASLAGPGPVAVLPRGRETGNMLHEILEEIDFHAAAAAASPAELLAHKPSAHLFAARLREYRLGEAHLPAAAALVWNALRAPLPAPGGDGVFRLCDVSDRLPEMEFLFPEAGGYLGGYMDLVFRHRGRYCLLDWKSNYLESYDPASVAADVVASRYDLQYMLYALALDKWLRSLLPAYDFDRDFGGVYYLYLRGMDASAAGYPGVFALRPTSGQMAEEFPQRLKAALGAAGMAP